MTYVYVAAGGALGSLARAWLSVLAVALFGPQFPWGTIGINILGSFVIALVGGLTAADGRLPAPDDIRAFVMVGICGGFTTFSSFSLQTFDLVRDGRAGLALANVAISVVVCIAAAAFGFWAATALNVGGQG